MRKFTFAVALAAAFIAIAVVVMASTKTQEVVSIQECVKIVGVKEYVTSMWSVPISQSTKLVLSDGREVYTRESAWHVRRFMIGEDAENHCVTKQVIVKK